MHLGKLVHQLLPSITFPKKHGETAMLKPASNAELLPHLFLAKRLKSGGLYSASLIAFLIHVD